MLDANTRVGFIGNREGMTDAQKVVVGELLSGVKSLSHGDCKGADEDAHNLAFALGVKTISHPPIDERLRAFCTADITHPQLPYLDRDRVIVVSTDILVATPNGMAEKFTGGTWYTAHYAENRKSPLIIVWPDGSTTTRNCSDDLVPSHLH